MTKPQPQLAEGFVVLLDALGVRNYSSSESLAFIRKRDELLKTNKLPDIPYTGKDAPDRNPTLRTFGDTILITWKGTYESILTHLAGWLIEAIVVGIRGGLLLRGAISYGEFVADRTSVLGPAVADAASWYEQAQWVGVVATPSVGMRIEARLSGPEVGVSLGSPNLLHQMHCFNRYQVPCKKGAVRLWALNWPLGFLRRAPAKAYGGLPLLDATRLLVTTALRDYAIPFGVEDKYANTIDYYDWWCLHDEQARTMGDRRTPPARF